MRVLRNSKRLASIVLAWFVLSLGMATASPLLGAEEFTMVCSSAGMVKLLTNSGDLDDSSTARTMDCPLCSPFMAPPVRHTPAVHQSLGSETCSGVGFAEFRFRVCASPLPARGPPSIVSI